MIKKNYLRFPRKIDDKELDKKYNEIDEKIKKEEKEIVNKFFELNNIKRIFQKMDLASIQKVIMNIKQLLVVI